MNRKKREPQIYPDEIFLDSENIPGFDTGRFEGRIEKPISKKSFLMITGFFAVVAFIFLIKIFSLQVVQGKALAARSENNRLEVISILPNRGIIYDRNDKKLAWNIPGLRVYSDLPGLGHLLGYVGLPSKKDFREKESVLPKEMLGKEGIEKEYNSVLSGIPGMKLIEMDSQNNLVSESMQKNPQKGEDVFLSIDSKIQSEFFKVMESVAKGRNFQGGAGVILDTDNGEVISLVSYPEYNSKILSAGEPKEKIREYVTDKNKPFLNRAISGLYAPGSIIKPLVALGALSEGIISPEKKIYDIGKISIPNPYFPEKPSIFYDWKAHGFVDMRKALAVSCDVYFYEIGGGFGGQRGLGIKKIGEYARMFGFGQKTEIDSGEEQKGTIPSPELKRKNSKNSVWRIGDTYNASIGQGSFQVTPIQMAVYAAALANGGKIVRPSLNRHRKPIVSRIDIPEKYFQIVREGMRMAVLEGTVSGLNISSVKIAAKTGTAEVGTRKKLVNSWVIGFLPYKNPKIAFAIVLEKGPANNLVGALYVARQLFDWMALNAPKYFR